MKARIRFSHHHLRVSNWNFSSYHCRKYFYPDVTFQNKEVSLSPQCIQSQCSGLLEPLVLEWFPLCKVLLELQILIPPSPIFIRSGRLKTFIEGEHTGQILNGLQCDSSRFSFGVGMGSLKREMINKT